MTIVPMRQIWPLILRRITRTPQASQPPLRQLVRWLWGLGGALCALDVHFISSLPVVQWTVCKAWADTRPVQIAWAES